LNTATEELLAARDLLRGSLLAAVAPGFTREWLKARSRGLLFPWLSNLDENEFVGRLHLDADRVQDLPGESPSRSMSRSRPRAPVIAAAST
jgi:hypothetical protein